MPVRVRYSEDDLSLESAFTWGATIDQVTYVNRMAEPVREIFGMLSASPVLRIGGASQDAMTEAPGPDVWDALVQFQKASNCR